MKLLRIIIIRLSTYSIFTKIEIIKYELKNWYLSFLSKIIFAPIIFVIFLRHLFNYADYNVIKKLGLQNVLSHVVGAWDHAASSVFWTQSPVHREAEVVYRSRGNMQVRQLQIFLSILRKLREPDICTWRTENDM